MTGEKWSEMFKEDDDYWEKKSEKYTEYPRRVVKDIEEVFELVVENPSLVRSGITTFLNNRNFLYAEQWEEYQDGTLLKKIVHDNGYGKKILEEQCKKLNLDKLEGLTMVTDD